jgi:DNA (cytosine-5)-methyltransferase 1
MTGRSKPRLVSLFSGCGGMDLGFDQAGYDIVWANDIDPDACETYRANIGDIIEGDVTNLPVPELKDIDVLTSGFPCQPFSNAGSRKGVTDPRGRLYENTMEFVEKLRPRAVVFENVRGLLSTKVDGEKLIDVIEAELRTLGYQVSHRLLNFSHFGVPQKRIRVVVIGVRETNQFEHAFPEITTGKDLTIGATLSGLTEKHLNQTELMRLNPQALYYGAMIPPGGSWKSLPYDILPDRWKNIRNNMKRYHYPNFFRRCAEHEISGTITAAFKPENAGVWHPIENRILSVREIARIQSFPDDFVFKGRTVKSKYQQIGNAVAPRMAFRIADQLKRLLFASDTLSPRLLPESSVLNVNQPVTNQKPDLMTQIQFLDAAE